MIELIVTEAELETNRTCAMKPFCEKLLTIFAIKLHRRLGSKYASELLTLSCITMKNDRIDNARFSKNVWLFFIILYDERIKMFLDI